MSRVARGAADEQACYDRAQQYTQVLRQVTDVLEACQSQRSEIFDTGIWSGSAAGAANAALGTLIDGLVTLQNGLATVITWHKYVARTIVQAKSDVIDNVVEAHRTIASLENDTSLDDAERTQQITTVVTATHGANVGIVDGTAAQILVSKSWKPPANALQELLDQKAPPPVKIPDGPVAPPSPRPTPVPVSPGGGGFKPPVTPGGGGLTPPTPGGGLTPVIPLDGGGLQPTPLRPAPAPAVPGGGSPAPPGPGRSGSAAESGGRAATAGRGSRRRPQGRDSRGRHRARGHAAIGGSRRGIGGRACRGSRRAGGPDGRRRIRRLEWRQRRAGRKIPCTSRGEVRRQILR
ncbi:hypothetical protein [Mycobacterium stomatepiae]|uniref:ESX-1 secretion-associated protein EspK n=1 Tax=Mycobacterium stomatepiae TaxID=470076 RepID=A0A7I7QBW5_9MYCO|nr:hypothetical protein [Mycobacterium stomatepiae]MCV7166919.1 hypothetical protein [Mycobacterium stomatepiae]BBY23804.1 hypothetical protein MSTO_40090 [Mycobacterium stomatepiae]